MQGKDELFMVFPLPADQNRDINTTQIALFPHGADENFHEMEELMKTVFMMSTTLGNDSLLCSVKSLTQISQNQQM